MSGFDRSLVTMKWDRPTTSLLLWTPIISPNTVSNPILSHNGLKDTSKSKTACFRPKSAWTLRSFLIISRWLSTSTSTFCTTVTTGVDWNSLQADRRRPFSLRPAEYSLKDNASFVGASFWGPILFEHNFAASTLDLILFHMSSDGVKIKFNHCENPRSCFSIHLSS